MRGRGLTTSLLLLLGAAAGLAAVPANPPQSFFVTHASQARISLSFAGVGDKPVPRLVIGVGAPAEPEIENGRLVAVAITVTLEQMRTILKETFAQGLVSNAFRWTQRDDLSTRFLLTIAADTRRIDSSITGDGAARFRTIVRAALPPGNVNALEALDLVGG